MPDLPPRKSLTTTGGNGRSDGISMGHLGMRHSLVSREVIADSLETVAGAMTTFA